MSAALSLLAAVLLVCLACLMRRQRKMKREMKDFLESVVNRDFTRKYPAKGRNGRLHAFFNTLSDAFLKQAGEKEAQQHYLREMLKLVDTGILAYDVETYETLWMNDAFTTMLNIPHVRNIRWLEKHDGRLFGEIRDIPLDRNVLITIHAQKQTVRTMTKASVFQTGGRAYKLIAFHNVSATMEEVESGAWKGLLNVMTHEIMNSVAPVASLSDTLKKQLQALKEAPPGSSGASLEDMEYALETIHRRSEGLLRFSETYRNLSRKIVPDRHPYPVFDLISSIHSLMSPSMRQKGIAFHLKTDDPGVTACLDRDLIEQVVINFITNATSAVSGTAHPEIHLFSGSDAARRPFITVADNGHGIPGEIRDKIFIPFFSTRKNGNGIGLSISREIVKLHGGEIHIQTHEGQGSAFTILFATDP